MFPLSPLEEKPCYWSYEENEWLTSGEKAFSYIPPSLGKRGVDILMRGARKKKDAKPERRDGSTGMVRAT